jgi:hypothetical protein
MRGKEIVVGASIKVLPSSNHWFEVVEELEPLNKGTRRMTLKRTNSDRYIEAELVTGQQKMRFVKTFDGLPPLYSNYVRLEEISFIP